MPEPASQIEPPAIQMPASWWRGGFFIIAGLLSLLVMEFFEGDLTTLFNASWVVTLILITGAILLHKKQKINRSIYLAAYGAPAVFLAFTFFVPFIVNAWLAQAMMVAAAILIALIPYIHKLFLAEAISFALITMTLYRFFIFFGIAWVVVLAIFLLALGGLCALIFTRLERHRGHLRVGWAVLFLVLGELFVIFSITPINIETRTLLLGGTFYFYFKSLVAKDEASEPMRVLRNDAIIFGILYIVLLFSAHWI